MSASWRPLSSGGVLSDECDVVGSLHSSLLYEWWRGEEVGYVGVEMVKVQ